MVRVSKPVADSKPVRLFVALDLPELVREDIAAWGEDELADPALRRVPAESLHVTLAFLGNTPPADVEPIAEAMEEAADRQRAVRAGRVRSGGRHGGRPRVVRATGTARTGRRVLQAEVEAILAVERALRAGEAAVLAARDGRQGARRGTRVEAADERWRFPPARPPRRSRSPSMASESRSTVLNSSHGCAIRPVGPSRAVRTGRQ